MTKDVVTDEHICACFDHFKYWSCLDYESCKDEAFVADHRVLIEDHKCLSEKPEEEESEYHNDWTRWYNYNFWVHWDGAANGTGFNWQDLFELGETEGDIDVRPLNVTAEQAEMHLLEFSIEVQEVLQKECERQVAMAEADYDCEGVLFSYSLLEWDGEELDVFAARFYFSAGFGLQFSVTLLFSMVLYFMF